MDFPPVEDSAGSVLGFDFCVAFVCFCAFVLDGDGDELFVVEFRICCEERSASIVGERSPESVLNCVAFWYRR